MKDGIHRYHVNESRALPNTSARIRADVFGLALVHHSIIQPPVTFKNGILVAFLPYELN